MNVKGRVKEDGAFQFYEQESSRRGTIHEAWPIITHHARPTHPRQLVNLNENRAWSQVMAQAKSHSACDPRVNHVSKAKYWCETDGEQVPWGKYEKNFEKRVKKYVKPFEGKRCAARDKIINKGIIKNYSSSPSRTLSQ